MSTPTTALERRTVAHLAATLVILAATLPAGAFTINANYKNGANPTFDPTGDILTAHFEAAIDIWQDYIQIDRNYNLDFWWADIGAFGDHRNPVFGPDEIRIDSMMAGGADQNWWPDPTPWEHSEFDFTNNTGPSGSPPWLGQTLYGDLTPTQQSDWFGGTVPPLLEIGYRGRELTPTTTNGNDLLTVVLHELGHMLGVNGSATLLPEHIGGASPATVAETGGTFFAGAHLSVQSALMTVGGNINGIRWLPSAVDVLVSAARQVVPVLGVDLPRQDYLAPPGSFQNYDTAANWVGNSVPDIFDDVYIRHGGTVFSITSKGAENFVMDNASKLEITGSNLTVRNATLNNASELVVRTGGLFDVNLGNNPLNLNNATLTLNTGSVAASDVNNNAGLIRGGGFLGVNGDMNNNGLLIATNDLTIGGTGRVDLDGSNNDGAIIVDGPDAVLTVTADLSDPFYDGFFDVRSGTLNIHDDLILQPGPPGGPPSLITVDNGQVNIRNLTVNGLFDARSGNVTLDTDVELTLNPAGEILVDFGATLRIEGFQTTYAGGNVTGAGTLIQNADARVVLPTTIDVLTFDMDGTFGTTQTTVQNPLTLDVFRVDNGNNIFNGTLDIHGDLGGSLHLTTSSTNRWRMDGLMTLNAPPGSLLHTTLISGSTIDLSGTAVVHGRVDADAPLNLTGTINLNDPTSSFRLAATNNTIDGGTITGPGEINAFGLTSLTGSGRIESNVRFETGLAELTADGGTLTVAGQVLDAGLIGTASPTGTLQLTQPFDTGNANRVHLNGGVLQTPELAHKGELTVLDAPATLRSDNATFLTGSTTILNHDLILRGRAAVKAGAQITGPGVLVVEGGSSLTTNDATIETFVDNSGTVTIEPGITRFNRHVVNAPGLDITGTTFFTDSVAWFSNIIDFEFFVTNAPNVALAQELFVAPGEDQDVGPNLTFHTTDTALSRTFRLTTLEEDAQFVFNDKLAVLTPQFTNALSVGRLNVHEDDDARIETLTGPNLTAVGFLLNDNTANPAESVRFYGPGGELLLDATGLVPGSPGGAAFVGAISDTLITAIELDEDTGGDDVAIADLFFARAAAAGRIVAAGAELHFDGGMTNRGILELTSTAVFGHVNSPAGSTIVLSGNVTFEGDLTGDPRFAGSGTPTFAGRYSPGDSPAAVNFPGSVEFTDTSTLVLELADHPGLPGSAYDQVNITDDATLAGQIEIQRIDGFTPDLGDTFKVLTYGGLDEIPTTITGTLIHSALALAPLFSEENLILRTSVPGDLNLDNKVSVADLSTFALFFDTAQPFYSPATDTNSWQLGDFNTDGLISVADLSLLALNFGFDATDPSSTPTPLSLLDAATLAGIDLAGAITLPGVPEPNTIAMLILLAPTIISRSKHLQSSTGVANNF